MARNLTKCSSRPPSHQLASPPRQARRRLNKSLDFVGQMVVTPRIHARDVGLVVGSWSVRAECAVGPFAGHPERVDGNFRSGGWLRSYVAF